MCLKDDEYVANCCLQAVLPTMEDTYDILRYARERVSNVTNLKQTIMYGKVLILMTEQIRNPIQT